MPPGAAQTTNYEVVTTYRTVNLAEDPLKRYGHAAREATTGTTALRAGIGALAPVARIVGAAFGGLFAAFTSYKVLSAAFSQTLHSLRQNLDDTIQLTSQLNLAAAFDTDPVENFRRSMGVARVMIREFNADARGGVPGGQSALTAISKVITGATFNAGGNLDDIRALSQRLAFAAPAAGATPEQMGRETQRMLSGNAFARSPLMMMLSNMPGSPIGSAKSFNALPASQRLKVLNEQLARLADNPFFRSQMLNTMDGQLQRLHETLVGADGIFGQLGADYYESFILWLGEVNALLEDFNGSEFLRTLGYIVAPTRMATGLTAFERDALIKSGRIPEEKTGAGPPNDFERWRGERATSLLINERANELWAQALAETGHTGRFSGTQWQDLRESTLLQAKGNVYAAIAESMLAESDRKKFSSRDLSKAKIEQHFTIKLDLKSDDSPEAIAVRITRAMESVGKNKTTARRAFSAMPGSSVLNP